MRGEGNSCPFPPGSSPRPAAALYQCAMYQQGAYEQRDALDRFLGQAPVQHASSAYSPHSNPYQAASPMVADNTPLYGSPGSFAGRKAMQPAGGFSSMGSLLSDGSNYQPYAKAGAYQSAGQASILSGGYGQQPASYSAGYSGYGQRADLPSQLNMPSAGQNSKRPPSAGRRAVSQPSAPYASYEGPSDPYEGSQYGQAAGSLYGQAAYNQYSQSPSWGGYGSAAGGGYGSAAGGEYGGAAASSYGNAGYGAAAGGGYGASAYNSNPSSAVYGGGGGYGGNAGYAPASSYSNNDYSSPSPKHRGVNGGLSMPAVPAVFMTGQKGQFSGKVSMQPPGGRTTLNVFS